MLKPITLLALLGLLGACASQPVPSEQWTRWVCDSQAEVLWRFADDSQQAVDVRLGGGPFCDTYIEPKLALLRQRFPNFSPEP